MIRRCPAVTAYVGPGPPSVLMYAGASGGRSWRTDSTCCWPSIVQVSGPSLTIARRTCSVSAVCPGATSICVNPNEVT